MRWVLDWNEVKAELERLPLRSASAEDQERLPSTGRELPQRQTAKVESDFENHLAQVTEAAVEVLLARLDNTPASLPQGFTEQAMGSPIRAQGQQVNSCSFPDFNSPGGCAGNAQL